jgi:MoaA/NifB/PqqE/SkfB family radical SAM enzyme
MKQIIDFNITNYCNAKCPTCKRFDAFNYLEVDKNLSVFHMDYKKFKKAVTANKLYFNDKECYFCGEFGDPMMHPKIKDFTEVSNNVFNCVTIFTNGGLNRPDFIEYVSSTTGVTVRFGIDGLTHKVNNLYRINVNTELAYKNMLKLAKYGKAKWDYTIFEHNKHEAEDVIKFALDNNIKLMLRCNLRPSKFGVNRITNDDFNKFKDIANKYKKETDMNLLEFDTFWIDYNES